MALGGEGRPMASGSPDHISDRDLSPSLRREPGQLPKLVDEPWPASGI